MNQLCLGLQSSSSVYSTRHTCDWLFVRFKDQHRRQEPEHTSADVTLLYTLYRQMRADVCLYMYIQEQLQISVYVNLHMHALWVFCFLQRATHHLYNGQTEETILSGSKQVVAHSQLRSLTAGGKVNCCCFINKRC
ncbi:hypothetical protein AMECASPLE_009422 [Ameca splendens]|uniref:Uncharacterized protein n=1 Tax=Ameca splendens TaxID=208324 RepID=A0ABV0XDC1_9TELE